MDQWQAVREGIKGLADRVATVLTPEEAAVMSSKPSPHGPTKANRSVGADQGARGTRTTSTASSTSSTLATQRVPTAVSPDTSRSAHAQRSQVPESPHSPTSPESPLGAPQPEGDWRSKLGSLKAAVKAFAAAQNRTASEQRLHEMIGDKGKDQVDAMRRGGTFIGLGPAAKPCMQQLLVKFDPDIGRKGAICWRVIGETKQAVPNGEQRAEARDSDAAQEKIEENTDNQQDADKRVCDALAPEAARSPVAHSGVADETQAEEGDHTASGTDGLEEVQGVDMDQGEEAEVARVETVADDSNPTAGGTMPEEEIPFPETTHSPAQELHTTTTTTTTPPTGAEAAVEIVQETPAAVGNSYDWEVLELTSLTDIYLANSVPHLKLAVDASRCLSLIGTSQELHLQAQTQQMMRDWLAGLQFLLTNNAHRKLEVIDKTQRPRRGRRGSRRHSRPKKRGSNKKRTRQKPPPDQLGAMLSAAEAKRRTKNKGIQGESSHEHGARGSRSGALETAAKAVSAMSSGAHFTLYWRAPGLSKTSSLQPRPIHLRYEPSPDGGTGSFVWTPTGLDGMVSPSVAERFGSPVAQETSEDTTAQTEADTDSVSTRPPAEPVETTEEDGESAFLKDDCFETPPATPRRVEREKELETAQDTGVGGDAESAFGGELPVPDLTALAVGMVDPFFQSLVQDSKGKVDASCCFSLTTANSCMYLIAESWSQVTLWILGIRHVLRSSGKSLALETTEGPSPMKQPSRTRRPSRRYSVTNMTPSQFRLYVTTLAANEDAEESLDPFGVNESAAAWLSAGKDMLQNLTGMLREAPGRSKIRSRSGSRNASDGSRSEAHPQRAGLPSMPETGEEAREGGQGKQVSGSRRSSGATLKQMVGARLASAKAGLDNVLTKRKQDKFFGAIAKGDVVTVRTMLEDNDELGDFKDETGQSALMMAASHGHAEVAALLLDEGALVDVRDIADNTTALHKAASKGHIDVVRLLVEAGADLSVKSASGADAMAMAITLQVQKVIQAEARARTRVAFLMGMHQVLGVESSLAVLAKDPLFDRDLLAKMLSYC